MLITSATNSILHTLTSDRETGARERAQRPRNGAAIVRALQVLALAIIQAVSQRFATGNGSRAADAR